MARDPRFADEVDFVLDPDDVDSVDEELPEPRHRASAPGGGRRSAVLVAGGLIGVVVAALVAGRSGGSPSAHASATPVPSAVQNEPTAQFSFSQVAGPQIAIRHDRTTVILIPAATPSPGPACRTAPVCRTTSAVPAAVLRALRARFGIAAVDSSTSVLTGPSSTRLRLRTRTVLAHTGAEAVTITIAPMQPDDRSRVAYADAGSGVSVTVSTADRPWTVTVMVRNPRTLDPDTRTPSLLAADPRLLTP